MRLLVEFDQPARAQQFSAFLMTQGIPNQVEQDGQQWEIWVKDEDQLNNAATELQAFNADPQAQKYQRAVEKADSLIREQEKKRRQIQKLVKVGHPGNEPRRSPLTVLMILICSLVAVSTNFLKNNENRDSAVYRALTFTALPPSHAPEILAESGNNVESWNVRLASIQRGEVWRLITPIFLHYGVAHIVFNMILLFQLGRPIEHRYGTFWFALLVLATAALSNLIQCTVPSSLGGTVPSMMPVSGYLLMGLGGMSGVVYGLFGFYWMKATYDPGSGLYMPPSTVIIMVGWLLFCMFPGIEQIGMPNVANWAHGVGLLVGIAAGLLPTRKRKTTIAK